MNVMRLGHFKRAIKDGTSIGGVMLHKLMVGIVEAGPSDRTVKYTISNSSVDRDKDSVSVTGWDLANFQRNPVVLWGHKAGELPIGKCVQIGLEDDALKAIVEFLPADMPIAGERAEAVLRMSRTGFLSATSVGFRPLEFELAKERDDGDSWWPPVNFIRQELMEFSIVSIPANPDALIDPTERAFQASQSDAEVQHQAAASAAKMQHRLARLRAYG